MARSPQYRGSRLEPEALRRIWFPLGELETKDDTRAIARANDLPVAEKADSQDLCFLAGTRTPDFLARHGNIADAPGAMGLGRSFRISPCTRPRSAPSTQLRS